MIFRPYKSDIRQIESLSKLGCNHTDIAMVLGITPVQLIKWEENNTHIAELLRPKPRPEYTALHPEFAPMVEEAFTCGGRRFYRFKEEYRMSTGRYKYYYSTLRELQLKLSLEDLEKFIAGFKEVLEGGKKKKDISLERCWRLLINLQSRMSLEFDVATVKKLAAVSYFDETEDLTTYSEKYGEEKIKLWEQHDKEDFFLTRRIEELLQVKTTSLKSFQEHLSQMDGIKKELDLDMLEVLQDNF